MGILQAYTFERNALKGDERASTEAVARNIEFALRPPAEPVKVEKNINVALRNVLGVLRKDDEGSVQLTEVGAAFQRMYSQDPIDAWRWLLTRALWKNVVPNGTSAGVNEPANAAGVRFNFFRTMLQTLTAMASQEGDRRFVYYDELLPLLREDSSWSGDGIELFERLIQARAAEGWKDQSKRRGLLDDLEAEFDLKRDNLNTVFNKAMKQTGLFEHERAGRVEVGIALRPRLNSVLQHRVRHMLDHDPVWNA
jgi:hypothetical protein